MTRFGTDGIRGRAGASPIDVDGARRVGSAAARWAREQGDGHVFVAHDTRRSGLSLSTAVEAGAVAGGATVGACGVLPTPGLAVQVARHPGSVGVMITASHNPAHDNGFKLLGPGAVKPDDAVAVMLDGWMGSPTRAPGGARHEVGDAARAAYVEAFVAALGPRDALHGRRLVVDLARGAATSVRDALAAKLDGVTLLWVGDGEGAINDGVGSEHPDHLVAHVRDHGADAGLAIDGDGDRALLVDADGRVVAGDQVAWLLATHLGVDGLAVTVHSTAALEGALAGRRVVRTPVGDRHLAVAMSVHGLRLGCEDSGHVLFADDLPGGDGLFTGLRALGCAFARAPTLAEAVAPFQPWPRVTTKVPAGRRPELDDSPGVQAALREAEGVLGASGRVLLRYSGTEPVLRVLVEGADDAVVHAVSQRLTVACAEAVA